MMSWYRNIWPFGRVKAEEEKRIEAEFQEQLKAAYQRRGDLEEATKTLREERERRQQTETRQIRSRLLSRPSFQE